MISLSQTYGLLDSTIWNDPANAALRERRPDMNVLLPGDVLVIPDKRPRMEKRPTAARHSFRRKGIPALFRLQVYDLHMPRANQRYTLTVDGVPLQGTTDAQGIVQQFVPASAATGELVIGDDACRIQLLFGHLDPPTEQSGLQNRLSNLGYRPDEADGSEDEQTQSALLRFQREHSLPETGEADSATLALLDKIHGDPYTYPNAGSGA